MSALGHDGIAPHRVGPLCATSGPIARRFCAVQKNVVGHCAVHKSSSSVRSLGEVNKGFQAIAATVTDYSKKAFEDGTRAFEQLIGAKSFEQAFEIQSQYAKKAFDAYIAQLSKLGEMYVDVARNAYKPVEQVAAKAGVPNRLRSA